MGQLVFIIPDDLHQRAKMAALQRGMTLKAFLTEVIQQGVEAHEATEEKRRRR